MNPAARNSSTSEHASPSHGAICPTLTERGQQTLGFVDAHRQLADDRPDDVHEEPDWSQAVRGLPPGKQHINIRIDADVLDWFRNTGKGYQTRINNVLRAFVEARRRTQS